jgi:hypothetical protein
MTRCVAADPRHGERWTRHSKAISNWKQGTREILILAMKDLEA